MRILAGVIAIVCVLGAVVAASPEKLTKAEIAAAEKAAQANLPPVDQKVADACKTSHAAAFDPKAKDYGAPVLADLAACLRTAGALGAAITVWNSIVKDFPSSLDAAKSTRQLGPGYEAAAFYADAATWYRAYATRFPGEKDARDQLVRAICIWRQLGSDDLASAAFHDLDKQRKVTTKVDSAKLCDTVRPIVVPPTPTPAP